ncbi:hypothetical protein IPM62_01655 [Candidatus Woesebacteria bacterium]|nr:MAG: hypothetical protein IPM62_01655 [Candidatus Woesebacteria bacterium]
MLGKVFDKLLHENEEEIVGQPVNAHHPDHKNEIIKPKKFNRKNVLTALVIFSLAVAIRFLSLYFVTDPQNAGAEVWYSDVYHHWQIAYLSKTIGFDRGFLRLWDLKGMEYFWGLMHPLIGALLITLTGSTSILVFRILSLVMGSFSVVLIFLLGRRYWNYQVGLAAAVFALFNPVGIFNDASGMVEPLGIFLMLLGIYFLPLIPLLSGCLLAMASMTRAEYWILSLIVLVGAIFLTHKKHLGDKTFLFIGYLIPIVFYMKYLLNWTGNAIYPVWWNYLGNAKGDWQANIPPTLEQLMVQKIYWAIAIVSLFGLFAILVKRPRFTPLALFGLGNWFMWGVVIGMTKYLLSYLPRFWVDRIMIWPYMFLGLTIAVILFYFLPKKILKHTSIYTSVLGWGIVVVIVFIAQFAWMTIHKYYDPTHKYWDNFAAIADEFSQVDTKDGKVLLPPDYPPLVYMLVEKQGLTGDRIVGQMFDPFYYLEKDVFTNWTYNRDSVLDWFSEEDIRLVFFFGNNENYKRLVKTEPEIFNLVKYDETRNLSFYEVRLENID